MAEDDTFQFEDTSHFTDADWAVANRLREAYRQGGRASLDRAMAKLAKDEPLRFLEIGYALDPVHWQNALRDALAAEGIEEDDLKELRRRSESPAREQ